jgi:hypothetical protein
MKNQKGCQKCSYLMLLNSHHLLAWKKRNLDTRVRIVDIQGKKIINTELQLCQLFCIGVNLGLSH